MLVAFRNNKCTCNTLKKSATFTNAMFSIKDNLLNRAHDLKEYVVDVAFNWNF